MSFRDRPEVWHNDEELRQLMRRIDIVVKTNSEESVKYPPVLEVGSVVLPSNFVVGTDNEKETWQENTPVDSLDVEEASCQEQDQGAQEQQVREEQECPQEHPTSTREQPADL